MAMTPEGKVKAKIKALLKNYGAVVVMPVGTGYGNSGVSDFVACFRGAFIAIEAKANGGKPTPLQRAFLDHVRCAGGYDLVIDEHNLHELENVLNEINERANA